MKNNKRPMKTFIKLFSVMALCLTLASCYWDDVVYVGQKPYLIVDYPVQTVVVESRPQRVIRRNTPPPPPVRHRMQPQPRRGGRR